MKNGIAGFIGAVIGAVGGYLLANRLLKDHYEQLADTEIQSVKDAFRRDHPISKTKEEKKPTESDKKRYTKMVSKLGYAEDKTPKMAPEIEYISPTEFTNKDHLEGEDYEEISLTYYSDGTLADDEDRAMSAEDIAKDVGEKFKDHFGEYEEDCIYVRNHTTKVDYEILADLRPYSQILKEKPYLTLGR